MKILEKEFEKKGWKFRQISREEDGWAVYVKTKGNIESWEVIKIRSHDGFSIAGHDIPPGEIYPSNNEWGVWGFTCRSKEEAFKRLDKEQKNREAIKAVKEDREKRGVSSSGRPPKKH